MPRLKKRTTGRKKIWDDNDRVFLAYGYSFFFRDHPWECGAGYRGMPTNEIPAETLAEMREGWEHFREGLIAEHSTSSGHAGQRPWAWWRFDAPESLPMPCNAIDEAEQLDAWGLLSEFERTELNQRARGRLEYYQHASPLFDRDWLWWRFISPERRDQSISEAAQLARIGDSVLTKREREHIARGLALPADLDDNEDSD